MFSWKKSDREDDYHLYEMDVATLTPRLLLRNDPNMDFGAVSGDGRYVAMQKSRSTVDSDVHLFDRDGSPELLDVGREVRRVEVDRC